MVRMMTRWIIYLQVLQSGQVQVLAILCIRGRMKLGGYKNGKVTTDEDYFRKLLIFREIYKSERDKYNEKKMKLEENENE